MPLAAWIDGEAPRAFWVLLGVATLAGLAGLAPYLATNVVLAMGSPDLFVPLTTLDGALGAVAVVLAFVAYARCTPRLPQAPTLLSGA